VRGKDHLHAGHAAKLTCPPEILVYRVCARRCPFWVLGECDDSAACKNIASDLTTLPLTKIGYAPCASCHAPHRIGRQCLVAKVDGQAVYFRTCSVHQVRQDTIPHYSLDRRDLTPDILLERWCCCYLMTYEFKLRPSRCNTVRVSRWQRSPANGNVSLRAGAN
jgi:hypothetical protein